MEFYSQGLFFLHFLRPNLGYVFFFLAVSFPFFYFLLVRVKSRLWCNCEICTSYVSSGWSKEFDNLYDWYTDLLQKSPTQTIHVHVLGNIVTANPENVEYMLKTRFENYPKGKPFSMILGDFLGKGIFNVDGDLWLFQRKMASLELASISVRTYAFDTVTSEVTSSLLPLLSSAAKTNGGVIDLQDVFQRFSFDNICKFSFGLDVSGCLDLSVPISLFAESFDSASKLSAERAMATLPLSWKIKRLFNLGKERKLREAIKVVNIFASDVITLKRKLGFSRDKDLLSRFMACIFDDKFLRDIVVSFILAGRDTMASALTTFFWLLANHPNMVSKIRDEANQVREASSSSNQEFVASYEQIRKMHYLHAAVYESLRLYPPVQFDSKFAKRNDTLPDGTCVRKGTRVTYHPYAMGRMEKIWGSGYMEFNPERWLENGTFCAKSPFEYPVFQAGVRSCLGKEMALTEIKAVALSVLHKFDIKVVELMDAPTFLPGLTATVSGGLRVVIRDRDIALHAPSSTFKII